MKKTTFILSLLCLALLFGGCKKEEAEGGNANQGIFGVVTDFATGEPVKSANVQLRPSGETTLTGSEGNFEFKDLAKGDYYLTVSKAEYTDLIDDYKITVNGKMMRRDVQIKKNPAYLDIVDNNLNPITKLEFGTNANSKQFVVFNGGPVSISCHVSWSCPWVATVTPIDVTLAPGETHSVIVSIDRSQLAAGLNTDYIHVTSNHGNKQLEITAIR